MDLPSFSVAVSSIPSGYHDLQIVLQGPGLRAVAIDSKTNCASSDTVHTCPLACHIQEREQGEGWLADLSTELRRRLFSDRFETDDTEGPESLGD